MPLTEPGNLNKQQTIRSLPALNMLKISKITIYLFLKTFLQSGAPNILACYSPCILALLQNIPLASLYSYKIFPLHPCTLTRYSPCILAVLQDISIASLHSYKIFLLHPCTLTRYSAYILALLEDIPLVSLHSYMHFYFWDLHYPFPSTTCIFLP